MAGLWSFGAGNGWKWQPKCHQQGIFWRHILKTQLPPLGNIYQYIYIYGKNSQYQWWKYCNMDCHAVKIPRYCQPFTNLVWDFTVPTFPSAKSCTQIIWGLCQIWMFPKIGVFSPPNHTILNRVFHYKPSILGGFPPIFGNTQIVVPQRTKLANLQWNVHFFRHYLIG